MTSRSMLIRGLAPILISLTVLSACGSSEASSKLPTLNGSAAASGTPSSTTIDPEKAAQEFVKCLRAQGIEAADPKVGADGQIDFRSIIQGANVQPGDDKFRTVMDTCGSKLAGAGLGRPSAAQQAEREKASLALTTCLRGQGLNVQDLPTGGGPGFGGGAGRTGGANGNSNPGTGSSGSGATTTTVAGSGPTGAGGGNGRGPDGQRPPQTPEERTARLAERLGVDPADPAVIAAFKSCDKEMTAMTTFRGGPGATTTTTAG